MQMDRNYRNVNKSVSMHSYAFERSYKRQKTTDTKSHNASWSLVWGVGIAKQFVIFKPLSYCFEETLGFDVKASFASRPEPYLTR